MKTFISLSALLFVFLLPISAQIQIGQDIDSSVGSVVISADGSRIAVGIPSADGASPNRVDLGRVTVYEREENEWVQLGESIFGKNVENYAGAGLAMSADGNRIAVGAPWFYWYRGHIRVFEWDGENWEQMGEDFVGREEGNTLGHSLLSKDGSIILTGSFDYSRNKNYIALYQWNGENWEQMGKDIVWGDRQTRSVDYKISEGGKTVVLEEIIEGEEKREIILKTYQWNESEESWKSLEQDIICESKIEDQYCLMSISLSSRGTLLAIMIDQELKIYDLKDQQWQLLNTSLNTALADSIITTELVYTNLEGNRLILRVWEADEEFSRLELLDWNDEEWEKTEVDIRHRGFAASGDGKRIIVESPDGKARVFEGLPELISSVEEENFNNILLYPNPTNGILNIRIKNESRVKQLTLYNSLGQILSKYNHVTPKEFSINLSSYPKGYYFVELKDKRNRTIERFKVIKS